MMHEPITFLKGSIFDQYGQDSNSHSLFPWWRMVDGCWIRRDGKRNPEGLGPKDSLLAEYDRENPMQEPSPMCGQVWHWIENAHRYGSSQVVTSIRQDGDMQIVTMGGEPIRYYDWPPEGAVLVSGPGSPWAKP